MPTVLETDDTKAWRVYKETDEVKQTFKNWGLGTIHSYMKARQMIYAKKNPTQLQTVVRSEMVALNSGGCHNKWTFGL